MILSKIFADRIIIGTGWLDSEEPNYLTIIMVYEFIDL
jgi:hypothetical protein